MYSEKSSKKRVVPLANIATRKCVLMFVFTTQAKAWRWPVDFLKK